MNELNLSLLSYPFSPPPPPLPPVHPSPPPYPRAFAGTAIYVYKDLISPFFLCMLMVFLVLAEQYESFAADSRSLSSCECMLFAEFTGLWSKAATIIFSRHRPDCDGAAWPARMDSDSRLDKHKQDEWMAPVPGGHRSKLVSGCGPDFDEFDSPHAGVFRW